MAPNRQVQGSPAGGSSDIEGLAKLVESLNKVDASGKKSSKDLDALNKRMASFAKETKRSKDPVNILSNAFVKLRDKGKDTGDAISTLTKHLEEATDVMTTSTAETLEDTIKNIKEMQADLVASGKGSTREAVILNTKRSKLEMEAFKEQRNFMMGRAKMLQQGSEGMFGRMKGLAMGPLNASMKHGASAAEALGGALGLTAKAMGVIAATVGVLLAGFMAFVWAAKKSSTMIKEMTEAGDTMASSLDSARMASRNYRDEVEAGAFDSRMTLDKMQELMSAMNEEYGRSLGLGAKFAGTVANVGRTFGMANEESVRLASKIAVLSRTTNQAATQRAFTHVGMEAAKLRLPMDALAEPMMVLADLAGRTGHNVNDASQSLALMLRSVEGLKKMGISAFQNMQPADIAKMTKEFSGFIAGIDEWQLAAMTYSGNESFQGMSERMMSMDAKGRVGAIKKMMDEYGLGGKQNSAELGMLLGAKDPSEAVKLGAMAQNAVSQDMSDAQYNKLMAQDIDKQLSERKTAGEAIQFGTDPTAFMMNKVSLILDRLIDIQNALQFWKGLIPGGGSSKSYGPTTTMGQSASAGYGAAAIKSRRPNFSVPLA